MTNEAYQKREATLIEKYGYERYQELKREWAKRGRRASTAGFEFMTKEERSAHGKRGGSVPRITKNKQGNH